MKSSKSKTIKIAATGPAARNPLAKSLSEACYRPRKVKNKRAYSRAAAKAKPTLFG